MKQTTNILIFFASWLLCLDSLCAQKLPDLIPYRKGDKWGYCDKKKNIVIPCEYDHVEFFEKDFARVNINNQNWRVDKIGKRINKLETEELQDYYLPLSISFKSIGLKLIQKTKLSRFGEYHVVGCLNNKDDTIIPVDYSDFYHLSKNIFVGMLSGGSAVIFNNYGKIILILNGDTHFGELSNGWISYEHKFVRENGDGDTQTGFINDNGTVLNFFWYKYCDLNGGRILSQDTTPILYDHVADFHEGMAMVFKYYFDSLGYEKGKCGFIDTLGSEVIPLKYQCITGMEFCEHFSEGLVGVGLKNKFGFIDKSEKVIIPFKYDYVGFFNNGLAKVGIIDSVNYEYPRLIYGAINKKGEIIIPIKYDFLPDNLSKEPIYASQVENVGYINRSGKEVIPFKYQDKNFNKGRIFSEGKAVVFYKNKCGYIDSAGKEIIPLMYDIAGPFKNGLAEVYQTHGDSVIYPENHKVLDLKYQKIVIDKQGKIIAKDSIFNDDYNWGDFGLSVVKGITLVTINQGITAFFDKLGNQVTPFKYKNCALPYDMYNIEYDLIEVECRKKRGLVDTKGTEYFEE